MENTVVGVYDSNSQAQSAMNELLAAGFDRSSIQFSPERTTSATQGRDEKDTGSGIGEGIAAQLFQPFVTSKESGMGIGLSICRTIVEAHGGRIWFEPSENGGTAFHFTLPSGEADQ